MEEWKDEIERNESDRALDLWGSRLCVIQKPIADRQKREEAWLVRDPPLHLRGAPQDASSRRSAVSVIRPTPRSLTSPHRTMYCCSITTLRLECLNLITLLPFSRNNCDLPEDRS